MILLKGTNHLQKTGGGAHNRCRSAQKCWPCAPSPYSGTQQERKWWFRSLQLNKRAGKTKTLSLWISSCEIAKPRFLWQTCCRSDPRLRWTLPGYSALAGRWRMGRLVYEPAGLLLVKPKVKKHFHKHQNQMHLLFWPISSASFSNICFRALNRSNTLKCFFLYLLLLFSIWLN